MVNYRITGAVSNFYCHYKILLFLPYVTGVALEEPVCKILFINQTFWSFRVGVARVSSETESVKGIKAVCLRSTSGAVLNLFTLPCVTQFKLFAIYCFILYFVRVYTNVFTGMGGRETFKSDLYKQYAYSPLDDSRRMLSGVLHN